MGEGRRTRRSWKREVKSDWGNKERRWKKRQKRGWEERGQKKRQKESEYKAAWVNRESRARKLGTEKEDRERTKMKYALKGGKKARPKLEVMGC